MNKGVNERSNSKTTQQALQARANSKYDGESSKFKKGREKWKANKGKWQKNQEKKQGDTKFAKQKDKGGNDNVRQGERRKFDKSKIQCYNCSKWGRFADECYFNSDRKDSRGDVAKLARDEDEELVILMVTTREEETAVDFWYLDTGCSTHMTGRKDWFINLDE